MNDLNQTQQMPAGPSGESTQMLGSPQATMMAIASTCPVCKTENPAGELYCVDCGFLLSSGAVAVEVESTPAPAKLIEKLSGREFGLKMGENSVGRQDADVLLTDGSVSRKHATIVLEAEKLMVDDGGSSNGTFVNGAQVQAGSPVEALNGAELKFGACALQLEFAVSGEGVAPEQTVETAAETPEVVAEEPTSEEFPFGQPESAYDEPEPEEPVESPAAVAKISGIDGAVGEFEIRLGENTLGRRSGNTIVLSGDPYVSGAHAAIIADAESCKLTDLGSTNGTMVNGDPIAAHQPVNLKSGDEVVFGRSKFRFETVETNAEPLSD